MCVAEATQTLARDFVRLANQAEGPPLADFFADFVKAGCEASPDDYRLVPLTPPCLRFLMTSSDCLTDCLFELQSKYQHFIPSDWGGHMEKGWRDLGVIGFNVEPGPVLEILEINPTTSYLEWAEPKWEALHWQRLLIRAVVDFGRACGAKQVRLLPAQHGDVGREHTEDTPGGEQVARQLDQPFDHDARTLGFEFDQTLDRFVLTPGS